MKKSLRASVKAKASEADRNEQPRGAAGNPAGDVDSLISEYSGMSESQLMQELLSATSKQKAEGRFDKDSVQKNVQTLLPMLDEGQKRKLFEILKKL